MKPTVVYDTLDDQPEVYRDKTYRYDDDGYLIEKTTLDGKTAYTYNTLDPINRRIDKLILPPISAYCVLDNLKYE